MKPIEISILLFVLFLSYVINNYVNSSDIEEMKGLKVNGKRIRVKTADCDKVTNITYIHNNFVGKCDVKENPIKFYPKITQVMGRC